jgi:hypothetical protein
MKDKRTYTHIKEHGEDMTHENEFKVATDDRGSLDLTKQIDELQETLKSYEVLLKVHKHEIWELKKYVSKDEKNKNLLQGYQKVIQDLSIKLRQKGL